MKKSSYNRELSEIFKSFPKIYFIIEDQELNEVLIDSIFYDSEMNIYSDLSPILRD